LALTPLPKINFTHLPADVRKHLEKRAAEREIPYSALLSLARWAASGPHAPNGPWYKDFGSFKLCGTAEYPLTVLSAHMKPFGEEID
jgi:hypothetical protein